MESCCVVHILWLETLYYIICMCMCMWLRHDELQKPLVLRTTRTNTFVLSTVCVRYYGFIGIFHYCQYCLVAVSKAVRGSLFILFSSIILYYKTRQCTTMFCGPIPCLYQKQQKQQVVLHKLVRLRFESISGSFYCTCSFTQCKHFIYKEYRERRTGTRWVYEKYCSELRQNNNSVTAALEARLFVWAVFTWYISLFSAEILCLDAFCATLFMGTPEKIELKHKIKLWVIFTHVLQVCTEMYRHLDLLK